VLIEYQINGIWHFDPYFQRLTYAPFYALLLGSALLNRRGPQALFAPAEERPSKAARETP
jgi:hypothetical protein